MTPTFPIVTPSFITVPLLFLVALQAKWCPAVFHRTRRGRNLRQQKAADGERPCPHCLSSNLLCPQPPATWTLQIHAMIEEGLRFKGCGEHGGDWLQEHENSPAPYSRLQIKKTPHTPFLTSHPSLSCENSWCVKLNSKCISQGADERAGIAQNMTWRKAETAAVK